MTTIDKGSPSVSPSPVEERRKSAELEHLSGYEFRIRFGDVPGEILSDEGPPLGKDSGPDPSRLLAAAVGNCLSASLLFCLSKSRVEVKGIRTISEAVIVRNEARRLRIGRIEARIQLDVEEPETATRCMALFEDYCTVTASIRAAIPVSVVVETRAGEKLYSSS